MSARQLLLRQVRLEQRAFWRNPESAFFTFSMPIGVLLIYGAISMNEKVPGRPDIHGLTLFVPGILAFAIVVTAYANLAATMAAARASGVLKRIRATPLNPSLYLGSQLLSVLATALLISVTTIAIGSVAFGAVPRAAGVASLLGTLALGIVCFAALGLAISTAIPTADSAGAITNGTYLPLAMVSGVFSSRLDLPSWLDRIMSLLPIKALADGLRTSYDPAAHGIPIGSLVVLAAWAVAGVLVARRRFRWEP
ncbi:MAG: type transporter [Acidimicrobiales bacterium]|nr:type transporter [Acidimicrobiales bacterium]